MSEELEPLGSTENNADVLTYAKNRKYYNEPLTLLVNGTEEQLEINDGSKKLHLEFVNEA